MLEFLGTGAAFNIDRGNTSAFFKIGSCLYLFDCGEKICDKILDLGLLSGAARVYVFITHLHSDHVGSLEPLLYYTHYFTDIDLRIYYPDADKLHLLLQLMGISFDFRIFSDFSDVENIRIECVAQEHISGSYGYFVYTEDERFFYSGDTSVVNVRALDELKRGEIDHIYHEVTIATNSMIHTHISDLEKMIPRDMRNRVILMHIANKETEKAIEDAGFIIADEIGKA